LIKHKRKEKEEEKKKKIDGVSLCVFDFGSIEIYMCERQDVRFHRQNRRFRTFHDVVPDDRYVRI